MRHIYSDEEIDFIKSICKGKNSYEITDLFNQKFNSSFTREQIRACMKNHKIKSEIERTTLNIFLPRMYSDEQIEFLKQNVKGKTSKELTDLFNSVFGTELTSKQIRAFKKNYKITSDVDCKFKKGNTPPNKGKKGVGGWKPTQFKKGNIPHNHMPVGRERVNGDGYVDIKIAEPNRWKGKHIIVWEENNGPVPKGYAIIFGDRNRRNFNPDNLILVSKQQLSVMNRKGLIQYNADATRSGVIIADIYRRIRELIKQNG